jgi:outer membrane protein assembly factor BamB
MFRGRNWSLALILSVTVVSTAFAQSKEDKKAKKDVDWTQWRGPTMNGNTSETAWLKKWPKVKVRKKWSYKVGNGYTAPSVLKDRLFTAGYKNGKDTVYCFNTKSGKPVWGFSYAAKNFSNMNDGGPSATPAIANGLVYMISREAVVHCLDAKRGKVKWAKNLSRTLGVKAPDWGFSGSPIVKGKRVYIDVGVVAAFNVKNGQRLWKTQNYGEAYSTPVPFTQDGKDYLAVFPARGLVILEEKTGKEVAQYPWKTSYSVNAATPLIYNKEIFISSGYGTGCALVTFDGKSLKESWKNKVMRNHMASCVRWEGYLYGFDESLLKCIDAKTGKEIWKQRGLGKGCLIMAEGKLIVLSDNGELAISEASPKGFRPVVQKKVLASSGCWSAPVLSRNKIYVRSPKGEMVCLDVTAK